MEVTHLNGKIAKKTEETAFSVDGNRSDHKAFQTQSLQHQGVLIQGLRLDESISDRLHTPGVFGDEQTKLVGSLAEEGGIDHQNDLSGIYREILRYILVNLSLDPFSVTMINPMKILQGIPVIQIGFEEDLLELSGPSF